jgi:hypothetical protein
MSDHRDLLGIDADVLMNLLATDQLGPILDASKMAGLICPRTEREALYLHPRVAGDARDAIDLEPIVESGLLARTDLDAAETASFVELAKRVDDGEAQVLAVCRHRSLPIATDDKKARSLAVELGVRAVGTADLLFAWCATVSSADCARALLDIELRATYRPGASDANRPEWDERRAG